MCIYTSVPHICIASVEREGKTKEKEKRNENAIFTGIPINRGGGRGARVGKRSAGNRSIGARYTTCSKTYTYLVEKNITRAVRGRSQRLRWHTKTRDASSHPRPTAMSESLLRGRGHDLAWRLFRSPRSRRRRAAAAVPGCIILAEGPSSLSSRSFLPSSRLFLLTHEGGSQSRGTRDTHMTRLLGARVALRVIRRLSRIRVLGSYVVVLVVVAADAELQRVPTTLLPRAMTVNDVRAVSVIWPDSLRGRERERDGEKSRGRCSRRENAAFHQMENARPLVVFVETDGSVAPSVGEIAR